VHVLDPLHGLTVPAFVAAANPIQEPFATLASWRHARAIAERPPLCQGDGMSRRETEQILLAIRHAQALGQPAALATVVRVHGSAYRREGARILIRADGTHECLLSGGCLEPAVAATAARVIATGASELVTYDLAEDSVWGLGIGCSGAVDIYIEPIEHDEFSRAWLDVEERGQSAVRVTPLSGASGQLLVLGDGGTMGELTTPLDAVERIARELLDAPRPHSTAVRIGDVDLFFAVCAPPPRLVIFGAGHDAVPLARGAWELGYDVTVIDVRDAFLSADRFPGATLVSDFSRLAQLVPLGPQASVVIMNHHLERDREAVRIALASDARFVGVLGPRSRLQKLVAALAAAGDPVDAAALARVRSPIGLALGAETPEEIAVSILGELIAVDRGFDGGFLTGRETGLHRPAEIRATASS